MNWSVFFIALEIGFIIAAIPLFSERMARANSDGDYRVLHRRPNLLFVFS